MNKLKIMKEVVDAFGVLFILVGFVMGVIFMLWLVPRTRLINTIPAQQECTTVTVYDQSQDFCKKVKDIK